MASQIFYKLSFLYSWKSLKLIYLDHTSKIFTTYVILCFQIQVPQLTGTNWIVLGIEFVKSMKCLTTLEEEKTQIIMVLSTTILHKLNRLALKGSEKAYANLL